MDGGVLELTVVVDGGVLELTVPVVVSDVDEVGSSRTGSLLKCVVNDESY